MRAVIQRVHAARVEVDGEVVGRIERGLVAFVGAGALDTAEDVAYLATKVGGLRVFEDDQGKMSLALRDIGGSLLAVSQFTVYGDVRRGRRPSFDGAMDPVEAQRLFDKFVHAVRGSGIPVQTGRFRARMNVVVENDGPVTILVDSQKAF